MKIRKTRPTLAILLAGISALFLVAVTNAGAQPGKARNSLGNSSKRQEIHCKHFIYGYPFGAPISNDMIIREGYALSSNDDTKFANWVAYKVDVRSMSGKGKSRVWKSDPWLDDEETLEKEDYTSANDELKTDRGHQAPLASLDGYKTYYEANYLSNITPQKSNLNQGVWKHLEEKVRELVDEGFELYVMTGTLYEREMPPLPKSDEPHKIPSGYWKIIVKVPPGSNDKLQVHSFIFDQETPRNAEIATGLTSVDEIEQRSGLDFFWTLDKQKEQSLETSVNPL